MKSSVVSGDQIKKGAKIRDALVGEQPDIVDARRRVVVMEVDRTQRRRRVRLALSTNSARFGLRTRARLGARQLHDIHPQAGRDLARLELQSIDPLTDQPVIAAVPTIHTRLAGNGGAWRRFDHASFDQNDGLMNQDDGAGRRRHDHRAASSVPNGRRPAAPSSMAYKKLTDDTGGDAPATTCRTRQVAASDRSVRPVACGQQGSTSPCGAEAARVADG